MYVHSWIVVQRTYLELNQEVEDGQDQEARAASTAEKGKHGAKLALSQRGEEDNFESQEFYGVRGSGGLRKY